MLDSHTDVKADEHSIDKLVTCKQHGMCTAWAETMPSDSLMLAYTMLSAASPRAILWLSDALYNTGLRCILCTAEHGHRRSHGVGARAHGGCRLQ